MMVENYAESPKSDFEDKEEDRDTTKKFKATIVVAPRAAGDIGEGKRPLFDRDGVVFNSIKDDKEDDRRPGMDGGQSQYVYRSYEQFRITKYYDKEKERGRDYPASVAASREFDIRPFERNRDERLRMDMRYMPNDRRSRSYEKRDFPPDDRKDRYDDRDAHRGQRRSPERRLDDRAIRRHPPMADRLRRPPPANDRRRQEPPKFQDRRARSGERDLDINIREYGEVSRRLEDYGFGHGHMAPRDEPFPFDFQQDIREDPMSRVPRGRGRGYVSPRGASQNRPYARGGGGPVRQTSPVRTMHGPYAPYGRYPAAQQQKSFRGPYDGRR